MKHTHICRIVSVEEIIKDTFDVVVEFPEDSQPGQFVHILCGGDSLLRRPISICDSGEGWLRFIFAVKGSGTKFLAQKKAGDTLDVLGPLGTGFSVNKSGNGTAILIGGGIGIFPLIKLAKNLSTKVNAILGFRTKDLMIMQDDFEKVCDAVSIATDDGSFGTHGLVTDVLKEKIKTDNITSIYACGPMPMMSEIKKIAEANNIFCELSLEERMGCGIGACAVCVCKANGLNVKVCQMGPVFNCKEVFNDA